MSPPKGSRAPPTFCAVPGKGKDQVVSFTCVLRLLRTVQALRAAEKPATAVAICKKSNASLSRTRMNLSVLLRADLLQRIPAYHVPKAPRPAYLYSVTPRGEQVLSAAYDLHLVLTCGLPASHVLPKVRKPKAPQ